MDQLIHDNERVYQWIHARSGLVRVSDFVGIAREVDGQIVAAFGYDHHQNSSCMFHVAAEPGGISRWMCRKGFEVPFDQWRYQVLIGVVQAGNVKSREIAARLGFTECLVLPGAHPSGALHWFSMYRPQCKWLTNNEKNKDVRRRIGSGGTGSQ